MRPTNGTGKTGPQGKKPEKPPPSFRKAKKRGRPTRLSGELIRRVAEVIRAGNYIETACAMLGISKTTYYKWLRDAAKGAGGLVSEFAHAIEKASAEAESAALARIENAGKGIATTKTKRTSKSDGTVEESIEQSVVRYWQADAWRLERRHPERWARRVYVENDDENEEQIRFEAEQEVERMADATASPGPAGITAHDGKVRRGAGGKGKREK